MTSTVAPPPPQAISPLRQALDKRSVTEAQWNTLANSLYPGAKPESVLLVLDYCQARQLDPMKKPCHIVPMKVKVGEEYEWRDVVLPGIYEYRTTAMRTGKYLGHTAPVYGEPKEFGGVTAPEWCSMTFKRLAANGQAIEFPVTVYFREVCNTKDEWVDKKRTGRVIANDRWSKAPIQMLTKVCEAAGLREAFPDEFGGEATYEEMSERGDATDVTPAAPIKPAQRVSAAAAPVAVEPEPERPVAPACVGVIVDVVDKSQGDKVAAAIVLDGGFVATTRKEEAIAAASSLRDKKTRVELVTKPSSDPAKYPPVLTEIIVLETGEATA